MKKFIVILLFIPFLSSGQDYNLISDLNYLSSEIPKTLK